MVPSLLPSERSDLQALTGDRIGTAAAAAALEELFSSPGKRGRSHKLTVLLVDEMDLLVTKRQSVSIPSFTLLQ